MSLRRPEPAPLAIKERELVVLLALLQALQALAIDMMLPALAVMSDELGAASANQRQWVIGIFLIGIGVGSLLPGPLADRYGRRPVLFAGLACYIVTVFACAFVRDFETLLVLRFVQAVGSSALSVIPPAIIRDRFEGDRMARLQSLISVIFMTVPMLAPTLGQAVMHVLGWRWIFGVMAALAMIVTAWAWLRLPETHAQEDAAPMRADTMVIAMLRIATTRSSITSARARCSPTSSGCSRSAWRWPTLSIRASSNGSALGGCRMPGCSCSLPWHRCRSGSRSRLSRRCGNSSR
jgi:MFS transporter, DHA1 family, multidrug resistance protein